MKKNKTSVIASKKRPNRKPSKRLNIAASALLLISVLRKYVLRKKSKGRVTNSSRHGGSKACACPTTCTPCKGLRPVDPAPTAQEKTGGEP